MEFEELLAEVIIGKKLFVFKDAVLAVRYPLSSDTDRARIMYIKKTMELRSRGVLSIDEMKKVLLKRGILDQNFYYSKDFIYSRIEVLQKNKALTNDNSQLARMEKQIDDNYRQLMSMENKEARLMMNTVEYLAEDYKTNYLVSRCLLYGNELDTPYWKSYDEYCRDANSEIMTVAKSNFSELQSGIPLKKIRAIARNQEWRKRWSVSKKTGSSVFEGSSSSWDKNKTNLCYWSDFYDNIFEYKNPPSDDIMNNDEELFNWIRMVNKTNNSSAPTGGSGETKSVNTPYAVRT